MVKTDCIYGQHTHGGQILRLDHWFIIFFKSFSSESSVLTTLLRLSYAIFHFFNRHTYQILEHDMKYFTHVHTNT